MKRVLWTFGSHYLKEGFPRFREQAESMNIFDEIHTCSEDDLDDEFKKKWGRHLIPYSRGFGYWCWKPWFLLKALETLDDGDVLLYLDLGCFLNPKGRNRLLEYYDMVEKEPTGILGTKSQEVPYSNLPETLYYENNWTKADVFAHYGVLNDREITHSTQYESGIIFFKKSPISVQFVKEWEKAYYDDYSLATDSPSRVPNLDGFRENRHDQSIYSMLAKKYKIGQISTSETFQRNWLLLENYPIWAMRDKAYPTKLHYRHRFRLRKLYAFLWRVMYCFK